MHQSPNNCQHYMGKDLEIKISGQRLSEECIAEREEVMVVSEALPLAPNTPPCGTVSED